MQIELLAVQGILSRWANNPAHIMVTTGRSLTPPEENWPTECIYDAQIVS